ncbi:MAG: alpha/beta fold hydrolase [Promethearchaeota archaeon]
MEYLKISSFEVEYLKFYVPPRNGELLAEKIPNAEIQYFDSDAHMIHTEETDKFTNSLIEFLK